MAHRELATCSTGRPQQRQQARSLQEASLQTTHVKDPVLRTNIKLTEMMAAGVEEGGGAARSGGKGQKGEEVAT